MTKPPGTPAPPSVAAALGDATYCRYRSAIHKGEWMVVLPADLPKDRDGWEIEPLYSHTVINALIAAETERCAKIVESDGCGNRSMGEALAWVHQIAPKTEGGALLIRIAESEWATLKALTAAAPRSPAVGADAEKWLAYLREPPVKQYHTEIAALIEDLQRDNLSLVNALELESVRVKDLQRQVAEEERETEHYLRLAFVDPGANPPVSWKSSAEQAEAALLITREAVAHALMDDQKRRHEYTDQRRAAEPQEEW